MTNDIQVSNNETEIITSLVLNSDLSKMTNPQKVSYYRSLCHKMGLNPFNRPFQLIRFQGKEILYATKDCTEQLRKIHGVSVTEMQKDFKEDIYIVTCKVQDKEGRTDIATGAINIKGLMGDALCNALMKAETKSKRRATLSICGLGMLDESETDTLGKIETKPIELSKEDEDKKNNYIDEISLSQNLEELTAICKKAKEEFLEDVDFYQILQDKYKERKEQLKFISEMGDDSDQRGLGQEPQTYEDKHA